MNPNYGVQNVQKQKINENQRNTMKHANQQQKKCKIHNNLKQYYKIQI